MVSRRPNRILGGAHDAFWAWCAAGELRLQRCAGCGQWAWPAVESCEACGSAALAWERLSGRGRIASWCSFARDYYAGQFPIPWDVILVDLDDGPLFLSNPHGFAWPDVAIGQGASLVFIPCEDDAGRFQLPVFAPAEPGPSGRLGPGHGLRA
ncbi:Zn-ribbon domain-containing OB-fold protein [Novosphingobium bradum]|uniref:Zn-ribbon domain-containing OB-fold protein n=1 Tax=Novosphingobium bradum TaxID=1737444 RepID=A0ABV7IR70_9SPHN